jgi:soluble lytic murein transglycosylase-like protein
MCPGQDTFYLSCKAVSHEEKVGLCFPLERRGVVFRLGICILLASLGLLVTPVRAQIASYVDESGRRVYINSEEPAPRRKLPARQAAPSGEAPRQGGSPQAVAYRPGSLRPVSREFLDRLVQETAERHRVDPVLVRAVVQAESGWNPGAVSRKGALGLMQLVPETAQRYGAADAFNPAQNLDAGVRYLRSLLERYGGDVNKSLAAYNAGEHAVDRAGGVPHYRETRHYVQQISNFYFKPGSGRSSNAWNGSRPIYRAVDERGRVVFTNE